MSLQPAGLDNLATLDQRLNIGRWVYSLITPFYLAAASALLLSGQHLAGRISTIQAHPKPLGTVRGSKASAPRRVSIGEVALLSTRILSSLALLSLSVYCAEKHGAGTDHGKVEIAQSVFYSYTVVLAFVTLPPFAPASGTPSSHLNFLLFVAFLILAYRNLLPYGTYTDAPEDANEGWITWPRLWLLGIAGVAVPLCLPRKYNPVDPEKPAVPNAEQTASYLSFMTMSFQDPVVFAAYRNPQLCPEDLPPLADYDTTDHLAARSFPTLDTSTNGKKHHLFWGIMSIYRWDYVKIFVLLIVKCVQAYVNPFAVRNLLSFLETGRTDDTVVRPWVWVLALLLDPIIGSIIWELHVFTTSRVLVRTEAIITQLVFERALRMRATESPDTKPAAPGKAPTSAKSGSNLTGRLTNLVSTDLKNIVGAKDFLLVLFAGPLRIALGIWFLYTLFGWAAFVGLLTMVLTFPIPGQVAKLIHVWQVSQMKKTDARVQVVSETINVIRMIKLFGWEKKAAEEIDVKREEELVLLRKKRLWGLINNNLK